MNSSALILVYEWPLLCLPMHWVNYEASDKKRESGGRMEKEIEGERETDEERQRKRIKSLRRNLQSSRENKITFQKNAFCCINDFIKWFLILFSRHCFWSSDLVDLSAGSFDGWPNNRRKTNKYSICIINVSQRPARRQYSIRIRRWTKTVVNQNCLLTGYWWKDLAVSYTSIVNISTDTNHPIVCRYASLSVI